MKRRIKRLKKGFKIKTTQYSDINKRLVYILSAVGIVLLVVAIVFISDAIKPPDITVASKDIFNSGMIRIGVRTDLGSYSYKNEETGEFEGFEIDVCEEVLRRIFQDQIVIRYEEINSTTKLSKLNRYEIDVCLGAFVPNSSPRIPINYSEGFFVDSVAVVTRKDQRLNILHANKIIIGTLNDSYSDKYLAGYFEGVNEARAEKDKQEIEVIQYSCYQDLFNAVETFDADALAASMLFINQFMQDDLVILPDRFLYHEYCFAFNARDVELVKVFSEAVVAMKADGTLDKIRAKWKVDEIFEG
jgi:aspartate/glutamate/glutamine transport system substrate-binding protein